jgi:hypothetical protein
MSIFQEPRRSLPSRRPAFLRKAKFLPPLPIFFVIVFGVVLLVVFDVGRGYGVGSWQPTIEIARLGWHQADQWHLHDSHYGPTVNRAWADYEMDSRYSHDDLEEGIQLEFPRYALKLQLAQLFRVRLTRWQIARLLPRAQDADTR